MGKIYVGQTAIKFEVDVATDVTGATCLIKYKKPSGEEASWPAVITDAANGVFVGEPASADDLAQAGRYVIWGYVTFADGKSAAGEPEEYMIYPEGYIER